MHDKGLVVLSGGMDSATALWDAADIYRELETISFDYGQRHRKELEYARRLALRLHLHWERVDLTGVGKAISSANSSLVNPSVEVPHGHYAAESMKQTVVPNRNMIMVSVAVARALAIGASDVIVGVHTGDHAIYPDCRKSFFNPLRTAVLAGNDERISIKTPFIYMTKTQIAEHGAYLKVPWELTWSCYEGGDIHCGECGTCQERREAFRDAGIEDPTAYKQYGVFAE
ncbi:MAG TPA: 7-cyano-7-deazaguanine synthase QueC [Candidatus Acidoferrum sp.]|nr:7-cyano-7-deazaguanine synthase QueC [Candidatus Acidoferrum sp.]